MTPASIGALALMVLGVLLVGAAVIDEIGGRGSHWEIAG